ncbi:hypothetical protein [Streptomyces tsukubensis]|uniref:hypothetical protein n=1 Tax=Streptomyces tsukubensis TaxID=83656 RepID=UPI0010E209E5|nr:hypothetical protein [Streptomyces tsukubensis]TAI44201.1 hypothetical protein EWI31_11915 [Streptomyces tsukubensis]
MARTSSTPRWQRVPTIPAPHPGTHTHPDRTAQPTGPTPIYEELLREWAEANRTLPGGPDLEWARTTRFPPPHDPLTGPPPPPLRGNWFHPA